MLKNAVSIFLSILFFGCSTIHKHPRKLMCSYIVERLGRCAEPKNALQGTESESRFIQSVLILQAECGSRCNVEIDHMYKTTIGIEYQKRSQCSYMRYQVRLEHGSMCDEWIGSR
jgi:hypothetical protein